MIAVVAPTEAAMRALSGIENSLSTDERRRAEELLDAGARLDYLAAHMLVRHCASAFTGRPLGVEVQLIGQPDGAPALEGYGDIRISLSHSPGWVTAAASADPIAVDVEAVSSGLARGLPHQDVWTPSETTIIHSSGNPVAAAVLLWTRKEALVKLGLARLDQLRAIETTSALINGHAVMFVADATHQRVASMARIGAGSASRFEVWT